MALRSRLFRGDDKLEAAAVSNPAHILSGAEGTHVGKIQSALMLLDNAMIAPIELRLGRYGPATARAVLAYKRRRMIINHAYQRQADDIVGVLTMAALDAELVARESRYVPSRGCGDPVNGGGAKASLTLAFDVPVGPAPAGTVGAVSAGTAGACLRTSVWF